MPSMFRDLASHLAALAIGGLLAFAWSRQVSDANDSSRREEVISARPLRPDRPIPRAGKKPVSPEAVVYAAAWESLKDVRHPRNVRLAIQEALLAEWSRHDPEAALRAFLSDRSSANRYGSAPPDLSGVLPPLRSDHLLMVELLGGCKMAHRRSWPGLRIDRETVERFLAAEAFGLDTVKLRTEWLKHLAVEDPAAAAQRLGELPARDRFPVALVAFSRWPSLEDDPAAWHASWGRVRQQLGDFDRRDDREMIAGALANALSSDSLQAGYFATEDSLIRALHAEGWLHENQTKVDPFAPAPEIDLPKRIEALPEPFRSAVKEESSRRKGKAGE